MEVSHIYSAVTFLINLMHSIRFASGPFLFTENGNILSNSSVITASEGEALQLICVARQPQDLQFDLNGREIRGHKVLTYLMGPQTQLQTSVAYKVLNKTAEKSFQNVSCGSTLVKIGQICTSFPPIALTRLDYKHFIFKVQNALIGRKNKWRAISNVFVMLQSTN